MKPFIRQVVCPPETINQLPISADHYPQGSAARLDIPLHLSEQGYLEEEYIVRGQANLYTWPDPAAAPLIKVAGAPYATRILVRKPADPARFSGCVMLESFNTASGLDHASSGWGFCCDEMLAAGDAWIGYTFGRDGIGFDALERFDPQRYAVGLGFPNPVPPEERRDRGFDVIRDRPAGEGLVSHAHEAADNRSFDRGLAHDLFFQLGALAKSSQADSPLVGYAVKAVFGVGVHAFNTYVAAFKDGMILPDGSQVIDGYLMYMSGPGLGLNREDDMIRPDDPRARATTVVPIIKVETSGDLRGAGGHPCWGILWRGVDSDEPGRQARWYEIPGTGVSHDAGPGHSSWPGPSDYARAGVTPPAITRAALFNPMARLIMAGAFRNLKTWVLQGLPPPRAAEYIRTSGERPDVSFVLDRFGNQVGGVRHPYVDVPVAVYDDLGGVRMLPEASLRGLYRNRADYISQVASHAARLAAERWILPSAVAELVGHAEAIAAAFLPDSAAASSETSKTNENNPVGRWDKLAGRAIHLAPGESVADREQANITRTIFNRRIPGNDANAHILDRLPEQRTKQLIPEFESSWCEYVPAGLSPDQPAPLVVSRHGGTDGGMWQAYITSWCCVAEHERFIVVFPDARWQERSSPTAPWPPWRGFPLHVPPDAWQVREMVALIDDVAARHAVDRTRIFMQGHSVGDMQTLQFALANGRLLAGIGQSCGPVDAANFFGADGKPMAHSAPVPAIVSYCSNNDMLAARPDDQPDRLRRKEMLNLRFWQTVNGAKGLPRIGVWGDENSALWRGERADVLYHEIYGRSHSQPFDEAEMMWSTFFSVMRRGQDGSVTRFGEAEDRADAHAAALAAGCAYAYVGNRKVPLDDRGSRCYAVEIPFEAPAGGLMPPVPPHLTTANTPGFSPVLYAPVTFLRQFGAQVELTESGQTALISLAGVHLEIAAGNIGVVWNGRLRSMSRQAEMRDGVLYLPVKWAAQVLLGRFACERSGVLYINDRYGELTDNMSALLAEILA